MRNMPLGTYRLGRTFRHRMLTVPPGIHLSIPPSSPDHQDRRVVCSHLSAASALATRIAVAIATTGFREIESVCSLRATWQTPDSRTEPGRRCRFGLPSSPAGAIALAISPPHSVIPFVEEMCHRRRIAIEAQRQDVGCVDHWVPFNAVRRPSGVLQQIGLASGIPPVGCTTSPSR
jgi:hypothetical protein